MIDLETCRTLFQAVPASVIVTDAGGRIVDVNPHHITHIAAGEFDREAFLGLFLPDHPSVVAAGLSEAFGRVLDGTPIALDDHWFPRLSGGGSGRFNVVGRPVERDGVITGAVFILLDVTEHDSVRRQLDDTDRQLRDANSELEEKMRQLMDTEDFVIESEKLVTLGRLIAVTAHETNNALMGVRNYVEFALRHSENERVLTYLGKADREIRRIARVMQEMLAYGRQSGDAFDAVDLADVIDRARGVLGPDLRRAGVTLSVSIADDLPPMWANEDAMEQVLVNLLSNARDALAGRKDAAIRITGEAVDGQVEMAVADNGPGIPERVQARMFEPFVTTKPKGKGTGLGLSICKRLIGGLRGTIDIDTAPERGTTMRVRIPVAPSLDDPMPAQP